MTDRTCRIDDCDRTSTARGLCGMHLQRDYRARRSNARPCLQCGVTFDPQWAGTKFCSPKCRAASHGQTGSGQTSRRTRTRTGSPVKGTSIHAAFAKKDWPGVIQALSDATSRDGECWVWRGYVDSRGYGRITVAGRRTTAHRLAAIAANGGQASATSQAHHKCGNTACCNPSHLQLVAPGDNAAEMIERHRYQRRIAALEYALADLDPEHPLLYVV